MADSRSEVAAGAILLVGFFVLAGCGATAEEAVAVDCHGIVADTAYQDCRRSVMQRLADQRLGYIVRSRVVR